MSEEPLENETAPVSLEGDLSYLSGLAVQMNEVYIELKRSGFTPTEALNIVGMIMSNFVVTDGYYMPNEDESSEHDDETGIRMEYLEEDDEEDY